MAKVDSTSKTQKALAWLKSNPTKRPADAARKFDIASSALYTAIKKMEETSDQRCPCCGNLMSPSRALKKTRAKR